MAGVAGPGEAAPAPMDVDGPGVAASAGVGFAVSATQRSVSNSCTLLTQANKRGVTIEISDVLVIQLAGVRVWVCDEHG